MDSLLFFCHPLSIFPFFCRIGEIEVRQGSVPCDGQEKAKISMGRIRKDLEEYGRIRENEGE